MEIILKNLNSGKPISFEEINKEGLRESAKQFSEGNKDLENLLLTLWNMNIITNACCKGTNEEDHHGEFHKTPYISINLNSENSNNVLTWIKYILNEKSLSKTEIHFVNGLMRDLKSNSKEKEKFCFLRIGQFSLTNEQSEKFFKNLLKATKKYQQSKSYEELPSPPALTLIEDLISRKINVNDVSIIEIKVYQKKKDYFAYGKYGFKSAKKMFITMKNLDNIKQEYNNLTTASNLKIKS